MRPKSSATVCPAPSEADAQPAPAPRTPVPAERRRTEIQAALRRRGVATAFSNAICDRLAPFSEDLTPELYDAVLSGVAMAYGVQRRDAESLRGQDGEKPDFAEVERLMTGFLSELRKLDEALETLAAYVSRLRRETARRDGVVH